MAPKNMDDLITYDISSDTDYDNLIDLVSNIQVESENDLDTMKKGFIKLRKALVDRSREAEELIDSYEKLVKKESQYKEEIQSLQKELKLRQDTNLAYESDDPKVLQSELARAENRIEELRNELKEYESKGFSDKADKDKLTAENDDLKKKLNRQNREVQRLEEENREFAKQIQHFRDERYARIGDENSQYRDKIKQQNQLINNLEDQIMTLEDENRRLKDFVEKNERDLVYSTNEMNKTTEEINKLRLLQQRIDMQIDEYRRENEVLKSQVDELNLRLANQNMRDAAITNTFETKFKDIQEIIKSKDDYIKRLEDDIIQMKETQSRALMDSDKNSVSALSKAIQDRDKQIEMLKKQSDIFAQEMDKSAAVINNLNKTIYENSKMYSKNNQYNINKQAEQRIAYLENMLKESEGRFRDAEQHSSDKEKELAQALQRLNEYESGDYQLQQAVNEIKGLKNQIKIRDRDIETITKHLNKLDDSLGAVLEENDDLRAKLGMGPRDKLNLGVEELNQLRSVRAQENRAEIHAMKREIEDLEEERTKLKGTIRKLAKQLGSKVNVASILDDGLDYYYDKFTESKTNKKDTNKANGDSKTATTSKDNEFMRKRNEELLQQINEYETENRLLEKGLVEIHQQLVQMNPLTVKGSKGKSVDNVIKCPTLDKLLNIMETNRANRASSRAYSFMNQILADNSVDGVNLALKGEIDYLNGRNEELRTQLIEQRNELGKILSSFNKAQDEIDKLNGDVRIMNRHSSAKDIFQPLKLPPGMAPSSQDIISALNEYLLDTLQELEEYKKVTSMSEKDLEMLRRKYAVARHQISLLYKDYIEENKQWKAEKEKLLHEIKKLTGTIEVDAVKLQEYDRLLETLEKDEQEVVRTLSENSRKMCVLRANEKQLQRKCCALEELDQHLLKENKKFRIEIIEMEIAVQQRIGYLERYKDMANFKIMSLHKQLEESVPLVKLEFVNKQYNDVVQNYRQILDRQEKSDTLTQSLHETEELNRKYESEINFLRRELENAKDKSHMLEESLNRLKNFQMPNNPTNAYAFSAHNVVNDPSILNVSNSHNVSVGGGDGPDSSMLSMAKRLTAIEMKELNERQRADHAQRMYDEQRTVLRQLENRNLELEDNYAKISRLYLSLQKTEQSLREELAQSISKAISDGDKLRISELEKQEHLLKLEVSRLRELTEIALYQTASLEFINNISKAQFESFSLIDAQSFNDDTNEVGKLHRQIILLQISEATAVRKLQQAENKCKKLEAQLIRTEQKCDRESIDFFNNRKEYISKITYLRSTVQDLRHKYTGSIPLKQQEKFNESKEKVGELRKELTKKLGDITTEKHDLEDRIAEYEARLKSIEMLKNAAIIGPDGSVKFNEKFLEAFKKSENLRMLNLKLERANRRNKDEIKFLEELNRKYEITIINLEEENLRLETEFDQKMLIWEHHEADLERKIDHLRKQHQMIESLAISFEEISGNMPDPSLPIANQLDQAMNIIRSHIKLLAEAKVQTDLSKKKIDELEHKVRTFEHEINIRDKAIAELRLRLPATMERDILISSSMNGGGGAIDTTTSVRAAQTTIESLQNRLKQKDDSIAKYQDLLKLAREEITKLNKQHEIEINNMIDKLNLTRDTNIQKLKQELKYSGANQPVPSRVQLARLQELEEVTVEHENTISALNQKVKKLTTEVDTWKTRYEMQTKKHEQDLNNAQKDKVTAIEKLNGQLEEFRTKMSNQDNETVNALKDSEPSKLPSGNLKSVVDKLKQELAAKEEQHRVLNEAFAKIRAEMVEIAKSNLASHLDDANQEERMKNIIEAKIAEYQDKLCSVGEDLAKCKKELKTKTKQNEELTLELEHLKAQMKIKDQRIKKLTDENHKLSEDKTSNKTVQKFNLNANTNDVEYLKRQIRVLEEKLKKQKFPAEKPFENQQTRPISKSPKRTDTEIVRTPSQKTKSQIDTVFSLKSEVEQWKTRYNYVLSENAVILREKNDLQVELARLNREIEMNGSNLKNENKRLRDELERLKGHGKFKSFPLATSLRGDMKAESKEHLSNEVLRLKKENEKLKERTNKLDELHRIIEQLKSENERLRNNEDGRSEASSSTASNLRKIGESGKSTVELEKTIFLMKKLIVKQQKEIDSLKLNAK